MTNATSYKVISMNPRGLTSKGRLNSFLFEATSARVDILLIQEHNISHAHEASALAVAKDRGYVACIGFAAHGRGGSAVFIRREAFELQERETLPFSTHLGGRVTVCHVPAKEGSIRCCSMYIPSQASERGHFLSRLRAARILTRHTILGVDANTVTDVSLDVHYPPNSTATYANTHAATFEDIVASAGIRDVYRLMEGNKRSYTRECDTVATRIDRLYGPTDPTNYEWLSIRVNASFGRCEWNPDHRALEARLAPTTEADVAQPLPAINRDVYSKPQAVEDIETLFKDITTTYDPKAYGYATVLDYFKQAAADLLLGHSADARPCKGEASLLRAQLQHLSDNPHHHPPSTTRQEIQSKVTTRLNEVTKAFKGKRGKAALRMVEVEERCTKAFHSRYRPNLTRKNVTHFYHTDEQNPIPPDH